MFTRVTIGDMGTVQLGTWKLDEEQSFSAVELYVTKPLIACLGSQIVGWH